MSEIFKNNYNSSSECERSGRGERIAHRSYRDMMCKRLKREIGGR